jgi:hypothetical protein
VSPGDLLGMAIALLFQASKQLRSRLGKFLVVSDHKSLANSIRASKSIASLSNQLIESSDAMA